MSSASSSAVDPKYKDEIAVAIRQVQHPNKKISTKDVFEQLTTLIINSYNDEPSAKFKSDWTNRIVQTLTLLKIPYINTKPDWGVIAFAILDNKLNKQDPAVRTSPVLMSASISTPSSSTTTTTTSSGSSSTQPKLTPTDKERALKIYRSLDPSKMWKLSSGTIVEKKMEEFALKCNYEHPCHSLIFDINDNCWNDIFTPSDLMEIKQYNLKQLTPLPDAIDDYLKSFTNVSNIDELYKRITTEQVDPSTNPDKEWVQSTIYNCYKLLLHKYFPLSDQSEADIMCRIWQAVDTVFDSSVIDCRCGEKSSNASSDSRNQTRTLASIDQIQRKLPGRKVDMIFKKGLFEFGCLEAGRLNVENGTKELCDGSFKMPKVMKDIFVHLSTSSPALIRDLSVAGFLIMETKFTLLTLDSPAGYVCRVNRLTPLFYPDTIETFSRQMLPIIQVIYQTRVLMESTHSLLIHDNTPLSIGFNNEKQCPIPPCFQYTAPLVKKRRRTTSSEVDNEES